MTVNRMLTWTNTDALPGRDGLPDILVPAVELYDSMRPYRENPETQQPRSAQRERSAQILYGFLRIMTTKEPAFIACGDAVAKLLVRMTDHMPVPGAAFDKV